MTAALLAPMLPLEAKTRKGDKYLAEGRAHEEKKEWDAALGAYEKALSEDPTEIVYQMAAQKARFQASAMHITNGVKIRQQGQLGEALLEFQKGFALNPSSTIAEQEILRTQDMIQRERRRVEETGKEAPPDVRGMTPIEVAKKEVNDRIDRLLPLPELKPLKPNLQDFKMINQTPKVLFETLALNAGINVLWDPEYATSGPKDKLSVTFTNATVQEALDYLAILTKSYWKPLSANTIFITMDNQNKRRDYEEEVTRVFYLTNSTSNADLTAMVTAIRTVADCQRLFPFESQSAIIAKCTGDRMALAEKIIHDLDKPRAEVVVDIFVIEASSVYVRNLTTAIASTGLNLPANFTPRTSLQVQQAASTTTSSTSTSTSTTSTTTPSTTTSSTPSSSTTGAAIPFSHIGQVNAGDFSTVLPSALLQATLSDTRTKVLQSPQIRSVDGQKATMKIGEKEPTASGSFGSGLGSVAGAGISPLVNTQFTYLDVGVNVEITPHVHDNGEISLHVSLDISSVTGQVNLGGINEPIIGQRKIEHDIRLREGEVSLLGGLLNLQDSKVKTGTPGLSSIPIIGRLFSGENVDRERDEIMIALVPHVVRRPDITPENIRPVASGPQNQPQVRRGPKPIEPDLQLPPADNPEPAAQPAPAAAAPAVAPAAPAPPATAPSPANPVALAPQATVPPATAPPFGGPVPLSPPATAPPGLAPPATAPPENPSGVPNALPPSPAGSVRIHFNEERLDKTVGDSFNVTILVENAKDVASAPFLLQYDPKILSLNEITRGNFWMSNGEEPAMIKNVQNDAGMASVRLSTKPGSVGLTGSGTLLTLNFKAVGGGASSLSVSNITLNNAKNQLVGSGSPKMNISVKNAQ
jgi:general secretion pathway protein D